MESKLSAAQDKISVAERRTQLLEQKNDNLQKELDSWNEEATPEVNSNLQFVASGHLNFFCFANCQMQIRRP